MNAWEKRFAEKVDGLRDRAAKAFDCFVDETVVPVFNELSGVTMTRDGYSGTTPVTAVTQTRTFEYSGVPGARVLTKTTFPENGVTEYGYSGKLMIWKKNRNGVWKYFYTGAQQIEHVCRVVT